MNSALDAVDFMVRHLGRNNLPAAVKCIMIQLYMPSDMAGYSSLILSIPAFCEDRDQSVTKELYVDLAKQLGVSKWKVEKDIRDLIRVAWKRRDRDIWWAYFPTEKKPSNKQFVARIADVVDLWQECCKEMEEVKNK